MPHYKHLQMIDIPEYKSLSSQSMDKQRYNVYQINFVPLHDYLK